MVVIENMGESDYGISSWSASAGYSASVLAEGAKVHFEHPQSTFLPNIQHDLIMTQ